MSKKQDIFHFSYSAKQQEEIRSIREKYVPKEENKIDQLRRLDQSATRPGTVAAIAVGLVSTLILGFGMCCAMEWSARLFFPGVLIGLIGLMGMISAYPIYNRITRKRREKLAPEIVRLTDELSRQP